MKFSIPGKKKKEDALEIEPKFPERMEELPPDIKQLYEDQFYRQFEFGKLYIPDEQKSMTLVYIGIAVGALVLIIAIWK